MFDIRDHKLHIGGQEIELLRLPVSATVRVWEVPKVYRPTGYYVDVNVRGATPSHPACSDPVYIGETTLDSCPKAALAAAKRDRIRYINTIAEELMTAYTSDYGFHTKLSWTDQKNEAYAYIADPTTPVPCLQEIAWARGVEVPVLVDKVMRKSERYRKLSGLVMGECQRCEDLIEAIDADTGTMEEILLVEFNRSVVDLV